MHHFWGDYVFSFFVAALFSLTFESPVTVMENILLKRGKIVSITDCLCKKSFFSETNKGKAGKDEEDKATESYVVTNNKL